MLGIPVTVQFQLRQLFFTSNLVPKKLTLLGGCMHSFRISKTQLGSHSQLHKDSKFAVRFLYSSS